MIIFHVFDLLEQRGLGEAEAESEAEALFCSSGLTMDDIAVALLGNATMKNMDFFIRQGFNPNTFFWTFLLWGLLDRVELLLKYGADPNTGNHSSPLAYVMNRYFDQKYPAMAMAELLISYGAREEPELMKKLRRPVREQVANLFSQKRAREVRRRSAARRIFNRGNEFYWSPEGPGFDVSREDFERLIRLQEMSKEK
jgi:hypothetical protein